MMQDVRGHVTDSPRDVRPPLMTPQPEALEEHDIHTRSTCTPMRGATPTSSTPTIDRHQR